MIEPDVDGRATTLSDVARAAGVHVSTASRVLTGSSQINVTAATRQRIELTARELGYRPNAIARALRSASTGAIGMLVPSLRNPVYAEIIRGAFDRAWERSFVVVLAEDGADGDAERAYGRLVSDGRIDGLLVAGVRPDSSIPQVEPTAPVPFVYVNRRYPGGHNVSMREEDAARLAAGHLLGLGHRRLGHLAGPDELDTARRRRAGFLEAVRSEGIEPAVVAAAFDERAGFEGMREMLERRPRPTGVFVSNFNQAIGALAAARAVGCRVPEDLSVITYDDDPISSFLEPPLSGIGMPLHEMGSLAVEELLRRLKGAAPSDVTVPGAPVLVERGSTAPAPAA